MKKAQDLIIKTLICFEIHLKKTWQLIEGNYGSDKISRPSVLSALELV